MARPNHRPVTFAICVRNRGYRASLDTWKIYRVVEDRAAAARGLLRIVDESGEDYLYPSECFVRVRLPERVRQALRAAS